MSPPKALKSLQSSPLTALSGIVDDIAGDVLTPEGLENLASVDVSTLPTLSGDELFSPCVGRVGKFICIGLNYADHAEESGLPFQECPIIFMKATSAIIGPNDDVIVPKNSIKPDWKTSLVSSLARKLVTSKLTTRWITSLAVANFFRLSRHKLYCRS